MVARKLGNGNELNSKGGGAALVFGSSDKAK